MKPISVRGWILHQVALIFSTFAMPLRRYTPPIARLQEEYSSMIAARVRKARRERERGPHPPGPKIPDNSEPWLRDPKTVDDLWYIAQCVNECVENFQQWRQASNNS